MIRLYTLVALTFALLHTTATAQQFVSSTSLISGHISHDKLSGMKARTQTLVTLVHNCLTAENGETPSSTWRGEYLAGKSSSGSLLRFGAQCSFYSVENSADKKAELLLLANDLAPLLGHFTLNNNDYGTIRATISRRNGCLYFELPGSDGSGDPGSPATPSGDPGASATPSGDRPTAFWLITADSSRLPYLPVTRREFLFETYKQLIRDTNEIATEWRSRLSVRPAAQQEAEKQSQLRQLKALYSGVDLEARTNIYLQNFITDEAYLQRHITLATALHRNALRFVDSLLHTDPLELARPAVISAQTAKAGQTSPTAQREVLADPALSFHGFADNLPGALLLVRPNASALDPYLSEDKPQFLLLGWRFDPTAPFAASLDQQLHENLDGRKIQDLLGK